MHRKRRVGVHLFVARFASVIASRDQRIGIIKLSQKADQFFVFRVVSFVSHIVLPVESCLRRQTAINFFCTFRLVVITTRHDALDLCHRDDGQEATEQQEQREEQSKTSDQHADVHPRWIEIRPAGRQKVT